MTDKEIIIDGVNVAGCEYFNGFCEKYDTSCDEGGNCIYKQLKRLEQENAELEAELQNFKDMAKKGLDEFKDVGGCWGCGLQLQLNQDAEDIKQLKAENGRLSKNAEDTYDMYKALMKSFEISNNQRSKYKQTLQEIRAIAENRTNSEDYLLGQEYTDLVDNILDLITKAEEE